MHDMTTRAGSKTEKGWKTKERSAHLSFKFLPHISALKKNQTLINVLGTLQERKETADDVIKKPLRISPKLFTELDALCQVACMKIDQYSNINH